MTTRTPITPADDGRIAPGHVTTCAGAGCGARGVYCHTDAGVVDAGGVERPVDFGAGLVPLLAGREDGTDADSLFCGDCASV